MLVVNKFMPHLRFQLFLATSINVPNLQTELYGLIKAYSNTHNL